MNIINDLNGDLSREYQSAIFYTAASQTLKEAGYMHVAKEMEADAHEELGHAKELAKQIDYLGGTPVVQQASCKLPTKAAEILRYAQIQEKTAIANYTKRIQEAESARCFALAQALRDIIADEQDHDIMLSTALACCEKDEEETPEEEEIPAEESKEAEDDEEVPVNKKNSNKKIEDEY